MSSTIPNSHENSSFSSKSVSEIDYFSDTVQLQPVVSKRSRDKSKIACLRQVLAKYRGPSISVVVFESTYFFQCPKGSLFFFIKSLLVYKFQGRQPFRTFKLNICFSNNAVLIPFCNKKLQDLKSKTY